MLPQTLSFVDIETTGTSPPFHRIIEIGILKVKNHKVVEKFNSLINPQTLLDPFISHFTGITDKELESAPSFYNLKEQIFAILKDSVIVAHNVRFDYGFLKNEFKRFDLHFALKHFCTIKLARQIYPNLNKYNLDSIIENFNIHCLRRHRAYDDAKVLWDFYKIAKKSVKPQVFEKAVAIAMKSPTVPLNISEETIERLPDTSGIYLFYGEEGMPLYIGKSINVKDRVKSHFSSDHLSSIEMKISKQIRSVEAIKTEGELGALLLESELIKKYQPLYNRKLRQIHKMYILKKQTRSDGYLSVTILPTNKIEIEEAISVLGIFKSVKEAHGQLEILSKKYKLCPKLLGLEKCKKFCFSYYLHGCNGACMQKENTIKYNLRFNEAFYSSKIKSWPFSNPILIKENKDNILIDQWCYVGKVDQIENIQSIIDKPLSFDYDTYQIIRRYLYSKKYKSKIIEIKVQRGQNKKTESYNKEEQRTILSLQYPYQERPE